MVKALVVYYSMFGNTEKVAKALGEGLRSSGAEDDIVRVDAVKTEDLGNIDLLCVGSPVQAWNVAKPVQEFLERLKNVKGLEGKKAFAFDTKIKSRLAGTAGGKIEKKLKDVGFTIVKPAESAVVRGREGPLEEGSEERFKQLGAELTKII